MSRHRHVNRLAAEALDEYDEEYDDDDDDDDDDNDYHRSTSSRPSQSRPTSSFVQFTTVKPKAGKVSKPPTRPAPVPQPVPIAVATVHARFNPGDYADDSFMPEDNADEQCYDEDAEYYDDDEVDHSVYGDYTPAANISVKTKPAKVTKAPLPPKPQPHTPNKAKSSQLAPIQTATPPKLSTVRESSPARIQRSAEDDAATAAAVEALRLEKLKLKEDSAPPSRPLSRTGSSSELSLLSLSRTFSPSPAPATPTSASLRQSASMESLSSFASHKRTQSRLAMVETDDKKINAKPAINLVVIGHVDAGKCFARGTKIRGYSGELFAVEDIRGGELLMGDDGEARTVTPGSITSGWDILYEITPTGGQTPFIVNGAHILVLVVNQKPVVFEKHNRWRVRWYEIDADNKLKEVNQFHSSQEAAQDECETMCATWTPLEWEVSVDDFLSCAYHAVPKLMASKALSFNNEGRLTLCSVLSTILGRTPTRSQLRWAAWYLGMWLSDGINGREWIVQSGPALPESQHHETMARIMEYYELFGESAEKPIDGVSTAGNPKCWFTFGILHLLGSNDRPSIVCRVLQAYSMLHNKHLPDALLCDSLSVRRWLLAGFIDGAGHYQRAKNICEIPAKHRHLIEALKVTAQSLGLRVSHIDENYEWKSSDTGEKYEGYRICVSGDTWDVISHCAARYQICPDPVSNECVEKQKDPHCFDFTIARLAPGHYYGFAVHGGANHRFLLHDFTVTHNSTMMGHLLYKLNIVSQKQIHRYEKESREAGKASFAFAWVMDQEEEERSRGITVDVAVKHFDTANRRVTLLDAPGHRDFIPNMISGASQADAAILVIPAVMGEFEGGFSDEGQIKEHAILARSLGVSSLIIAINKCDAIDWNEQRYKQILSSLLPFLKSAGFKDRDIVTVPVSGLIGENLLDRKELKLSQWYTGPTLLQLIDALPSPKRSIDRPFRCCVNEMFKSQALGVTVAGRIDSGIVMKGDTLLLLPSNESVIVKGIEMRGETANYARAGDSVELGLRGLSDDSAISIGSWLCDSQHPIPLTARVRAQILTLTNLTRPIIQGETCLLYTQSVQEPVVIALLVATLDKATNTVIKTNPRALGRAVSAEVEITSQRAMAMELFKEYRELGRFALRRGKETIAVGIVTQIL